MVQRHRTSPDIGPRPHFLGRPQHHRHLPVPARVKQAVACFIRVSFMNEPDRVAVQASGHQIVCNLVIHIPLITWRGLI